MKTTFWTGARARYNAGVWAAPFALLPGFVLSAALSQPSPLEPLAQLIIQLTPVPVADVLLNFFGPFAKPLALLGALACCFPIGGLCGVLSPSGVATAKDLPPPERARRMRWLRWARWALSGTVALAGAALLAMGAISPAGIWPALLAGVCFLPAFLPVSRWRRPRPPMAGRRRALSVLAGATITAAGIAAIGTFQQWADFGQRLIGLGDSAAPLFPFRAPGPRAAGFPVAGLAPEVTPQDSFYLMGKNTTDPVIFPDEWKLSVSGHVAQSFTLSYNQLRALPRTDHYVTLRCVDNLVDGHLMSNALWSGVPIAQLLQRAGPLAGAQTVILHAADAFDEVFPLSYFADVRALLAYGMNGETLLRKHGGPARAVVPGFYGFKNVKWIEGFEVVADAPPGFWEQRNWTASAPHLVARIDLARREGTNAVIAGYAFAGAAGISAVQVRLNAGDWQAANLNAPALSPYTWVQWRLALPLASGSYTITARAIDAAGHPQEATDHSIYPNGATGLHSIQVTL